MEAAECFWRVNRLKSTLSNVSMCERFQTVVDCVGRVRRKMCRLKICLRNLLVCAGLNTAKYFVWALFGRLCLRNLKTIGIVQTPKNLRGRLWFVHTPNKNYADVQAEIFLPVEFSWKTFTGRSFPMAASDFVPAKKFRAKIYKASCMGSHSGNFRA